jgi:hypothetical protein
VPVASFPEDGYSFLERVDRPLRSPEGLQSITEVDEHSAFVAPVAELSSGIQADDG